MKQNRTLVINRDALKTFASKTPQVLVLAAMLTSLNKDSVCEETIEKTVKSAKWGTALKTKQDPYLIFRYYRKTFVDAGVITVPGQAKKIQFEDVCVGGYSI